MPFELAILFLAVLTVLALGVLVYFHARHSASNILFVFLCIDLAFWAVATFFSTKAQTPNELLFWIRTVLFLAAPQHALFFLFMHTFPNERLRLSRFWLLFLFVLVFFQMVIATTPYLFSGLREEKLGEYIPVPAFGMFFFALIVIGGFFVGTYWLIKHFLQSEEHTIERARWRLILAGFLSMIVLILSFDFLAVILFDNSHFIPFTPLFTLPFVFFTGYAIVRLKFLNIKVIATEFLVVIIILVLLLQAFSSNTVGSILLNLSFAFVFAILGILLFKSVKSEVRKREEVAKLAKKLKKANIQLRELDELKTEFMSIASHQLRSPLSVIKGYVSLIKEGVYGHVNNKLDKVLDNMYVSNEHLIRLVDEFLNISRMEQGRLKYDFTAFDVVPLVNESLKELKLRAKAKGLKLNFENKLRNIKEIVADKEKMHHVVYNFIDNAIKYTEEGSIVVSLEQEVNGVTYRVKDTGLGFGPEDQANFFQKFYRGRNVKGINIDGTGLGLYVCRKFIEGHHGKIWAKSSGPGKGAEFGFWVPTVQLV